MSLASLSSLGHYASFNTLYIPPGPLSGSLLFGADGYISTATRSNLSSSNFTAECWIYLNTLPNATATLLTIGSGSTGLLLQIYATNNSTTAKRSRVGWVFGSNAEGYGITQLTAGAWHHIAFVNYSSSVRLYINGKYDNFQNISGTTINNVNMKIGANTNNSALFQNYMTGIRIISKAVYSGGTTTGGTQQIFTPPLCPIPISQSASTNITDLNGTDAVFLMRMLKTNYFTEATAGTAVTVTGTVTGNELTPN